MLHNSSCSDVATCQLAIAGTVVRSVTLSTDSAQAAWWFTFTVQYTYYTGLDSSLTMEWLICWRKPLATDRGVRKPLKKSQTADLLSVHDVRNYTRLPPVLCNGSTNHRSKCFETKHVIEQATLSLWLIEKCKNRPKTGVRFLKNWTAETEFSVFKI